MHRYLAVRITDPHREYAPLFRLDRAHRRRRKLVPLEPGQREAYVELFLLEGTGKGRRKPLELVHTFHLEELPRIGGTNGEILLEAQYDGRRTADFAVTVGRYRDQATCSIHGERRRRLWLGLLIPLLLLAGWWVSSNTVDRNRRSAGDIESGTAPGAAETSDAGETAGAGETARAAETPEAGETAGTAEDGEPAGDGQRVPSTGDTEARLEPPPRREIVIYFEPDRIRLTEEARSTLRSVADRLPEAKESVVRIVGHTALFGTEEGRFEISRGRAERVYEFLLQLAWEPETTPTVAWEASQDPVTLDRDEQWRNRRVEIEVGPAADG